MGGQASEVSVETTDIILEAATFVPEKIRKSAASLGIRTDASTRFEKALDPCLVPLAIRRALELLQEIYGDRLLVGSIAKAGSLPKPSEPIAFSWDTVESLLGVTIPIKEGVDILRRLGFRLQVKGRNVQAEIPTWRATKDVRRVEDLVEEVIRVYGYAGIPPVMPTLTATASERIIELHVERRTKELLSLGCRLQEAYTYSFIKANTPALFGTDASSYLRLHNPIAADRPLLRRSVLESLFDAITLNGRHGDELRLFELGYVFHKEKPGSHSGVSTSGQLPAQPLLAALVVGKKGDENPFTEATRCMKRVFGRLGYDILFVATAQSAFMHPGRQAKIMCQGVEIGCVGELHPNLQSMHDTPYRLAVAEWNVTALTQIASNKKIEYVPISVFPEIIRDMAFVVDSRVQNTDLLTLIKKSSERIGSVELFDVYRGKGLEEEKKSLAYRITYRPADKALTSEEIDAAEKTILEHVGKEFGAVRRA
jgi:phenylalanyl-tRNA synthetase beta chain